MSEENVEVVRRIHDGWGVGDLSVGGEDLDPQVAFIVRSPFPEPATLVGPRAISEYMRGFLKQFKPGSHTLSAERIRASGDTVLVEVRQQAAGRTSGIEAGVSFFVLYTFRGGKIVRIEAVLDRDDALEAAGLSE
jgi:ketosteroid isomerase-like protein